MKLQIEDTRKDRVVIVSLAQEADGVDVMATDDKGIFWSLLKIKPEGV